MKRRKTNIVVVSAKDMSTMNGLAKYVTKVEDYIELQVDQYYLEGDI